MIFNFFINIYPILTEFFVFTIICFLLLFGVVFNNSTKKYFPIVNKSVSFLFFQTLIFSFVLLVNSNPIFMISWNGLLICDSLSFYSKFIILILFNFWFFTFFTFINKNLNFEFWILNLLSLVSMFFIIQSYDLLSTYISIEALSLVFYILSSIKRNSEFSTEAGLKYFILGSFSSILLLFGFTLLYSFTGLSNFQDFCLFFTGFCLQKSFLTYGISISLFFILTSFLFKIGSAPFHFWLPDVYEGSSIPVTAFFSTLPKFVILVLVIRFFSTPFLNFFLNVQVSFFLLICVFLSSLIGTFGAFYQKKWKRFIAYSSISHLSFILVNLCSYNLNNLVFYLVFYLIMTAAFFAFFAFFNSFKFVKVQNNRFFNSLSLLNILNPTAASSVMIILFSMAGIPPLTGFFAKFFVLFSTVSNKFIGITIMLLILNCVACFYYIKIIKIMYFDNNKLFKKNFFLTISLPYTTSLSLGSLIILIVFAGLNFDFIFILSNLVLTSLI